MPGLISVHDIVSHSLLQLSLIGCCCVVDFVLMRDVSRGRFIRLFMDNVAHVISICTSPYACITPPLVRVSYLPLCVYRTSPCACIVPPHVNVSYLPSCVHHTFPRACTIIFLHSSPTPIIHADSLTEA